MKLIMEESRVEAKLSAQLTQPTDGVHRVDRRRHWNLES